MNIIKKIESVKYSFFTKEPFSSQSSILVYKNDRGQYRVVEDGEQLTNTELKAQKFNTRYTLECGSVNGQIMQEFPSPVTEINYDVKLDFQCDIIDPVLLIKSGIGEDVKGFLQEHVYSQVLQLSKECSLESLPSVKEAFPHNLDLSFVKEKGLEIQVKGEIDLTSTLRDKANQQVTIELQEEFPSSDLKETFEVSASIDCKVEDLTTYIKSGITSLREFVTKELMMQFRRLTEKYYIYQLEEARGDFPNKINTVNIRAKGIGVYITGELDLSRAVKQKLSQQVNTKFVREYPSADTGKNFEISTTIYVNIQDRLKYLKSNIHSLEQFVVDEIDLQLRRIAQQYSTKPDRLEEIRNDMNKKLDLLEFEIKGLEVNIKASVDLSEELKKSIRTHTDKVEALDRQQELKNKELEELLHMFSGTPVDYLFALYDDPKELKKYILNEHNNSMASKQALKDKYTNGDIDDIQFRRGMAILGDQVLIGNETTNRMKLEEGKVAENNNNGNSFAQSATILADNIEDEDFN